MCGYFRDILRLSDGQFEGRPFELDISQKFIAGSIFGWKRQDGFRRFRRAYIEEGKGNGKSPFVGGIGLYGMSSDDEPGAQIYSAGAKKEQAAILFRDACNMVLKSEALSERIKINGGHAPYNMYDQRKLSFFRPISRESGKTGSGPRPHFALIDELHEHPNRSVMEMLERGFKFRRQPLLLMITNSGSDRNSVCWEEHIHAINVAHGDVLDDTTFSYVCALDDGDDPLNDPSCWIKANPLLGKILTHEYLQGVVDQAKAIPGKLNGILRLHFCVWTDAEHAWITRQTWESIEDKTLDMDDFMDQPCWAGLDLSATNDLTAVAYCFLDGHNEEGKPKYALFARGFTPADTLDARALRDKAPYQAWVKDGWLIPTPGPKVRLDHVAHHVVETSLRHRIEQLVYDKYLIRDFENHLDDLGATLELVEHPQGWNRRKDNDLSMPSSIETLENLIAEKRIRVEYNLMLRSAVVSAAFKEAPSGLRRFEKMRSLQRIDPLIAAVQAVGAAEARNKNESSDLQVIII